VAGPGANFRFRPEADTHILVTMSNDPTAKVLFRIIEDDGSSSVETLWAVPLDDDLYKLDNSPFYAYGVSWQDTVYAPFDPQEEMPTFVSVVEKSGNRTVRLILDPPASAGSETEGVLRGLIELGCSYEGANFRYFSVTVPPGVELESVREYLIELDVQWEHADPTYGSLFPDDH